MAGWVVMPVVYDGFFHSSFMPIWGLIFYYFFAVFMVDSLEQARNNGQDELH